jgi:tol-pal system protein YbgF
MIRLSPGVRIVLIAGVLAALGVPSASAQSNNDQSPGFLEGLFGGDQGARRDQGAQGANNDLSVRIDRLEAQIRQMTGVIEDLQYRNQQLTDQLRRLQGDAGAQASVQQPSSQPSAPQQSSAQQQSAQPPRPSGVAGGVQSAAVSIGTRPPPPGAPAPGAPAPGGRRGDAFDPTQNPNAPGAPRTLGTVASAGPTDQVAAEEPPPAGGRGAGEPLNLSLNPNGGVDAGNPQAGGQGDGRGTQVATLPPSDSPKDYYDLANGYMQRKDYALAEDTFRTFLRKFPSDRVAPDAEFYLGESLFQRQRYRDAAEAFLNVSTKYETTPRAPDALLRLGQSLAFLGEKEAACASLGEVLRKYPRARIEVKQGVDREQKRDGC